MKKIIVIAASILLGLSAFAQETNKDAEGNKQYGPYETNKFFDNWFITAGAGVNWNMNGITSALKGNPMKGGLGLGLDFGLGKWIEPCWGIRLGWQGLSNEDAAAADRKFGDDKLSYLHGDILWNISNQFGGYKELRTVSFVPYLTAGYLGGITGHSFAAGAGMMIPIRLGNVVSLVPDFRLLATKGSIAVDKSKCLLSSATLGLQFNLGKNNWKRAATSAAEAAAVLAVAEAARNAAQSAADKAAADANNAAADAEALAKENANLKDALANAPKDNAAIEDLLAKPMVVYFEIGQSKLSKKEQAHLEYIVKNVMSRGENVKFTVSGNADSKTGSKKRNQQLSEQRAKYISDLLTNTYGIDADRFEVKANGGNDIFDTPELNRAVIIEKM